MLPIAILAGGLATRLRPLTDHLPKSLLPVAGRPFIAHQLELLRRHGFTRAVLCVGHLGEQIQSFIGDGSSIGFKIDYSFDGSEPLGTGGALLKALPLLSDEFFVLNGDSYLPCSYAAVQAAYESARRWALMTVIRNDDRWDRSNVLFKDGALLEYDKYARKNGMAHIDYGVSVLSKQVFAHYTPRQFLDLARVCRDLAKRGQLAGLELSERFYEIGSMQGLADTEAFLRRRAAVA